MTVTEAPGGTIIGPVVPGEVLWICYQHRLLTTRQVHLLHRPLGSMRAARRAMRELRRAGLAQYVKAAGTSDAIWYLTAKGAAIAESSLRSRVRPYRTTAAVAKGPLRGHTLAVNEVGLAFVTAARHRGDECSPHDWEHEVAFRLTERRAPGRPNGHLCVPDAVLHYTRCRPDGQELLARFIEVDRGTETVTNLAQKLRSYVRLHNYRPKQNSGPLPGGWREQFLVFPKILVVLCDRAEQAMASRRDTLLQLCAIDPVLRRSAALDKDPVAVLVTTLPELVEQGPFAPIFWTPMTNGPVDVTGQTAEEPALPAACIHSLAAR